MRNSRSLYRTIEARRKRNLSVMVGRESEEAQEQIVSSTIQRILEKKGDKRFRLKLMGGGGTEGGMGEEIVMGDKQEEAPILSLQVFQEVKKSLVLSKKKQLCFILWQHKVTIEPRVREKLAEIDHLLDTDYDTIRVQLTRSVTVEEAVDPTVKRRGRKSSKLTKKVTHEVEEENSITVLRDVKSFLDRLIEERGIWPPDVIIRISMDGGDNSLKFIANVFSKHQV